MKEIYHCFSINAPLELVFNTLTTKIGLAGWWTKSLDYEGTVGSISTFRFSSGAFNKMKIVKIEPDYIEWQCVDGHDEWIGSYITFELGVKENGTQVCFSHFGFKEQTEYVGMCSFFWANYFISLQQYCETGQGSPNPGIL